METHRVSQEVSDEQIRRLKELKQRRDNEQVEECLKAIKKAAEEGENTMYPTIEAVRAYATVQEICDAMKEVYGTYRETPVI